MIFHEQTNLEPLLIAWKEGYERESERGWAIARVKYRMRRREEPRAMETGMGMVLSSRAFSLKRAINDAYAPWSHHNRGMVCHEVHQLCKTLHITYLNLEKSPPSLWNSVLVKSFPFGCFHLRFCNKRKKWARTKYVRICDSQRN